MLPNRLRKATPLWLRAPTEHPTAPAEIRIREATDADRPALERLAALDSRKLPRGRLLVAEVDGELRAALSLDEATFVADPFEPTADVVALLSMRAAQTRADVPAETAVPIGRRSPCPTPLT